MGLFILFSLVLISCNEENIADKHSINENDVGDRPRYSNFENPYDSIGIAHNLILDAFIARRDSLYQVCDSSTFVNEFNEILSKATCEVGYKTPETNCQSIIEDSLFAAQSYFEELDEKSFSEFVEENVSNPNTKGYIFELYEYFDNINNIDSLLNEIEEWEYTVSNDTSLNDNDKQMLLMAGSIARYSVQYWYEVNNNESSPWHYDNGCTQGNLMKKRKRILATAKWQKVAKSDYSSFVSYSIYTLVIPGTQPWVIGAAAGHTAASSAATAVWVFWEDITGAIEDAIDWLCFWCDDEND